MHHIARETPWEEIWQAMETLVAQGKVIYVGSSNFAGWHIAQAQAAAAQRNFLGLVSEQCIYNQLTRTVELEVLPAAQAFGLGVIPWSPLHGGLLGGAIRKLNEGTGSRSTEGRSKEGLEQHRAAIEAYEKLCADLGEDPANVALAWLLSRPAVTAPIIGPRTMEHLESQLAAADVVLTDDVLDRIDEIVPPGLTLNPAENGWISPSLQAAARRR
jgi:NDP-hexose 2,3-enoyl reductase